MSAQFVHSLLLTGSGVSFSLAVVILILSISKAIKKHRKEPSHQQHADEPIQKSAQRPVPDKSLLLAEETAQQIVRDAEKEAAEILKRAKTFDQQTIEDVDKTLIDVKLTQQQTIEQIAQNITRTYQEIFANIREENINTLKNVSKEIEKMAITELGTYKNILSQETVGLEEQMKQKVNQSFEQAQHEIEQYKSQRIAQVDREIQSLLERVLKEVLGKTIPLADQQKLILEGLKKAKEEGVFSHADNS